MRSWLSWGHRECDACVVDMHFAHGEGLTLIERWNEAAAEPALAIIAAKLGAAAAWGRRGVALETLRELEMALSRLSSGSIGVQDWV